MFENMQGMPQEQLALPLLVLLGQQRRYIAVQTQTGPLKLIAELYDKAQESLYLVRRHTWPQPPVGWQGGGVSISSDVATWLNCLVIIACRGWRPPWKADESPTLQYVEFLSSALSSEAYSSMLPSIADLVSKYQLDIEVALQVPMTHTMPLSCSKSWLVTCTCSGAGLVYIALGCVIGPRSLAVRQQPGETVQGVPLPKRCV